MKIINREEFLKLPNGVLFSEYEPCYFQGLQIKNDSCGYNDYYELDLIGNIDYSSSEDFVEYCVSAEKGKKSMTLDFETIGRNGMFDEQQQYAVYEKEDLENLIMTLQKCVPYDKK